MLSCVECVLPGRGLSHPPTPEPMDRPPRPRRAQASEHNSAAAAGRQHPAAAERHNSTLLHTKGGGGGEHTAHCTHMLEAVHGQKFVKDCSTTLLLRHTFTLLFCFSPTSALYILHCFSIRLLYLASPVPTLLQCYNMCILPLCMGEGRLQEFGGRLSKLGLLSH